MSDKIVSSHKMDSCFPPLGALSLKDSRKSLNLGKELGTGRRSVSGAPRPASDDEEPNYNGKIEILQDLDLYYIRQIAHNLKVRNSVRLLSTEEAETSWLRNL